jgi:hypothetical protein
VITHFTVDGFFYGDDWQQLDSLPDHVRRRLETANPERTQATGLAARLREFIWLEILTDWERSFLDSTQHYKKLSPRQEAALWRIHGKLLALAMRS